MKAWYQEGVLNSSQMEATHVTTDQIFASAGWKETTEQEWAEFHGAAAAGRTGGKPMNFLAQMKDGRNAYVYADPWDLSGGRYTAFQAALTEVDLRLDQQSLLDALKKAQESLKGDQIDIGKAYGVLESLRQRVSLTYNVSAAKRLASIMILVDGEDPDTFSFKIADDKAELWAGNEGDFFFKTPFKDFFPSTIESSSDLEKFLKDQQIMMELIKHRMLQSMNPSTTPSGASSSTPKPPE